MQTHAICICLQLPNLEYVLCTMNRPSHFQSINVYKYLYDNYRVYQLHPVHWFSDNQGMIAPPAHSLPFTVSDTHYTQYLFTLNLKNITYREYTRMYYVQQKQNKLVMEGICKILSHYVIGSTSFFCASLSTTFLPFLYVIFIIIFVWFSIQ